MKNKNLLTYFPEGQILTNMPGLMFIIVFTIFSHIKNVIHNLEESQGTLKST